MNIDRTNILFQSLDSRSVIGGLAGFFIGVPLLLVLGLLYLLLSPIMRRIWTWREKRFSARMAELGRSTSWTKTLEAVDAGLGTIILERWTDYARIWWTPNDVALECPEVLFDCDGEQVEEAAKAYAWVRAKYCDPENGSALLLPPEETKLAWTETDRLEKQDRCVSVLTWLKPSVCA